MAADREAARTSPKFGTARDESLGLEGFPHLRDKVCALWGKPEMQDFVRELMLDSRDGMRKGLPGTVVSDLVFLAEANRILRALDLSARLGIGYDKALQTIERDDHARLALDRFDDPLVSRDTVADAREHKAARDGKGRATRRERAGRDEEGGGWWRMLLNPTLIAVVVLGVVGYYYRAPIVAYLSTPRSIAVESQPSRDGVVEREDRGRQATRSE